MSEEDKSCPSTASTALRVEMIEAAKQFMSNPKVRGTAFEDQKKFLLDKGVTEAEIEEARKQVPQVVAVEQVQYPPVQYQENVGVGRRLFNLTESAVVIGGASYMAYKFMRSWVLPKFFNYPDEEDSKIMSLQNQINDLQNSTKFVLDSVQQILSTLSFQQEQFGKILLTMSSQNDPKNSDVAKISQDMEIVKSLLLNKNQFPAIPSAADNLNGVLKPVKTVRWQANPSVVPPSWQLASESNTQNGINGFSSDNHPEESERVQSEDELFHEAESNGHA